MGKPSRVAHAGTFFITTQTNDRRRLFQVDAHAMLFLQKLEHYRGNYLLHAYVVMPDHIHLLLTPGNITVERCLQYIKGGFSHALGSNFSVWQRGFTDHRIRNEQDAANHIRYIEQNPVEARLTEQAAEYRYSSANPDRMQLDPLPDHLASSLANVAPLRLEVSST